MIQHHAKCAYKRLKVFHKISSRQSRTDRPTGTMIVAYSLSSLYGKGGGGCAPYNDLFCNNNNNNNNNVHFYVLFLQIRAHSPLARYKNTAKTSFHGGARARTLVFVHKHSVMFLARVFVHKHSMMFPARVFVHKHSVMFPARVFLHKRSMMFPARVLVHKHSMMFPARTVSQKKKEKNIEIVSKAKLGKPLILNSTVQTESGSCILKLCRQVTFFFY